MLISLDEDRNVACSFRFFDLANFAGKTKQGRAIRQE
jgi:hypothetical protein